MTDKTDALVARLRMHARDCVSAADMDTDTVLSAAQIDEMADAFNQAAEALAAPAEGGQGEVVDLGEVIREKVREHGSYRAASKAIGVNYPYLCQMAHDPNRKPSKEILAALGLERVTVTRRLIDSAGGAKGGEFRKGWDAGRTMQRALMQPAEGDGAVRAMGRCITDLQQMIELAADYDLDEMQIQSLLTGIESIQMLTRPAATAQVPDFQRWSMTRGSDGARWSVYMDHNPHGEWVKWADVQQHAFGVALAAAPAAPNATAQVPDAPAIPTHLMHRCQSVVWAAAYEAGAKAAAPAAPKGGVVDVLRIPAQPGLDPITAYFEDYAAGQGRVTVACYGDAWTASWGAMGDCKVREFVASVDAGYLSAAFLQLSGASGKHRLYTDRIARALTAALATGEQS